MANSPSKPLVNWLQNQSVHLDGLLGQVRLLRRITIMIRGVLPEPLASHCLAANLNNDILVLGCDSSAWAAKLHYQLPQLLSLLQRQAALPTVSQIRVRVQPIEQPPPETSSRRIHLSEQSGAVIASVADNIGDPDLKAALHRLGQRAKLTKKYQ